MAVEEEVEEEEIFSVSCAGCRRVIGVTTSVSPIPRIYCTEACHDDFPVSDNESRDDLILYMLHKGKLKGQIAGAFGLSRQRVIQIQHARRREGALGGGE